MQPTYQPNANLDLSFTRIINVPRAQVWRAWTEPALLKPWFCPLPWKTIDCEIDLRPGGLFRTTMQSPEGAEFPNAGCYLGSGAAGKASVDQCAAARFPARQSHGYVR